MLLGGLEEMDKASGKGFRVQGLESFRHFRVYWAAGKELK